MPKQLILEFHITICNLLHTQEKYLALKGKRYPPVFLLFQIWELVRLVALPLGVQFVQILQGFLKLHPREHSRGKVVKIGIF